MLDLPPQPEPTLVLVPAHDQYGPPDEVEAPLAAWPDATIEVVDGCDHFLAGAIGAHHRSRRRLAHGVIEIRRATQDEAPVVADLYWRAREAAVPAIPPSVHPLDDVHRHFATEVLPAARHVARRRGRRRSSASSSSSPAGSTTSTSSPTAPDRASAPSCSTTPSSVQPDGLDLWAFRSNTGARRFYERHGFVAVAFTEGDNEEGEPDVRYHWSP